MNVEVALESELNAEATCAHEVLVYVGSGGTATFRQCESCGAVLISQTGRTYLIRNVGLSS